MEADKSKNLQNGQLLETQKSQYSSPSLLENFAQLLFVLAGLQLLGCVLPTLCHSKTLS